MGRARQLSAQTDPLPFPRRFIILYLVFRCLANLGINGREHIVKINRELLKGSTVILVLTSLKRRPMYGYELIREMQETSGDVFQLKQGTLYPMLHSLESEGLVTSYWNSGGPRARKYYRITDRGLRALQERKTEWIAFRSALDRVLGEVVPCR